MTQRTSSSSPFFYYRGEEVDDEEERKLARKSRDLAVHFFFRNLHSSFFFELCLAWSWKLGEHLFTSKYQA